MTDTPKKSPTPPEGASKLPSYKMQTIDQIFKTMSLPPTAALMKQYEEKEIVESDLIKHRVVYPSSLGQIFSKKVVCVDSWKKYAIAVFDVCYDPYSRWWRDWCAYEAGIQLFDLETQSKILTIWPFVYRSVGNSPFYHSLCYHKAKILEETDDSVLFGIESHDTLKIIKYDIATQKSSTLKSIDLDWIRQIRLKIEQFEKAFDDLDTRAICDFISEPYLFTTTAKMSDDYVLAMLQDPYGDTWKRFAKTKLIVKGKWIIDLACHPKEFRWSAVTQWFDLEDVSLSVSGDKLILQYTIKETQSIIHSMWSTKETLGKKSHKIEIDTKTFDLPKSPYTGKK